MTILFPFYHSSQRRLRCPGKVFLLFAILLSTLFPTAAQPFQKRYSDPAGAFFTAQDLCADTDEGYFVTGSIQGNRPQAFVLKTDLQGDFVWASTYTSSDPDYYFPSGTAIRPTSDNGLAISGLQEKNALEEGGVLLKTNAVGAVEWAKTAPCVRRNSELCTDAGHIYYASQGKGVRKVYMAKVSNAGAVLWERWLEAGDMDFYRVESLVRCANGDLVVALLVSKIENGTLIGPEQTILFRLDPAGTVQQVAFFPVVHLSSLVALADGRIAFRCSASDITWTGLGVMDSNFNWVWFKKARFEAGAFLPNLNRQELAVTGDESRVTGVFYSSGGEKIALTLDLEGELEQKEVYFSTTSAEQLAHSPDKSYVRLSGIRSDAFMLTHSGEDGSSFDDCYFPGSCALQLSDTLLQAETIIWQSANTNCLQDKQATMAPLALNYSTYCVDPGIISAAFEQSDSSICSGGSIDFQRISGREEPVFGTSEWAFEGGIPVRATGAEAGPIRFNEPGEYRVRHIFTLAGCRDTAYANIQVLPPPLLNLGADTSLCSGDTLPLHAGTAASYLWSSGESGAAISVHQSGSYALTVTQAGGCSATDAIQVHFLSASDVNLGPDTTLCPDASIKLFAPATAAGQTLRWSTGAVGDLEIPVSLPGLYSLEMDAGACVFSDTILVQAADCSECQVYAPNVFSPEQGGQAFQLFPGCPVLEAQLRVYDRWGNLVFESSDLNRGWDGRWNGKLLPPGVYLFDATLQVAGLQRPLEWKKVSGSVALLR